MNDIPPSVSPSLLLGLDTSPVNGGGKTTNTLNLFPPPPAGEVAKASVCELETEGGCQ